MRGAKKEVGQVVKEMGDLFTHHTPSKAIGHSSKQLGAEHRSNGRIEVGVVEGTPPPADEAETVKMVKKVEEPEPDDIMCIGS